MPQYWILKTEPDAYSWDDLVADGRAVWDGVRNNLALKHMRTMRRGDRVLIYHTGAVKALVGEARVTSAPYPDPKADDDRFVVFDLEPVRPLGRAVPLAEIKGDSALADLGLVRMGRLSVVPATAEHWQHLMRLGKGG